MTNKQKLDEAFRLLAEVRETVTETFKGNNNIASLGVYDLNRAITWVSSAIDNLANAKKG